MERISKYDYFMKIADCVSERSTCLRRHYGAVIVKDDRIVSTGYNGAAVGDYNCCDTGECVRDTRISAGLALAVHGLLLCKLKCI